jgi:hypothetical protein
MRVSVMYRGSRKHILDWTDAPNFCTELIQLLKPVEVCKSTNSIWMPQGYCSDREARLETFGPKAIPGTKVWNILRSWWLAHETGANTPNWDLALSGNIEGKLGLVLVEAKANVNELSPAGKSLSKNASEGSRANHIRIGEAIGEASTALKSYGGVVNISHDSHYQLSNRIAFSWKLASLGVPTVLVYLGFTGDWGISDIGPPLQNAAHWDLVFSSHAEYIVSSEIFEKRLNCGMAPAWILVRSRSVIEQSPTKSPHASYP